MIITMKKSATKADIEHVMKQLKDKGLQIHESIGENLNVFGVVGDTSQVDPKRIEANKHVESVVRVEGKPDVSSGGYDSRGKRHSHRRKGKNRCHWRSLLC